MPDEIRDILVGTLLGDAHISRRSPTSNTRLTYAQTAVAHKEYFDYVYSFFITFCVDSYIPQLKIVRDNRTKKLYSAISFTTMQLPCFNVFKQMFYVLNVKIVPNNIYELLTPRGLLLPIKSSSLLICKSSSLLKLKIHLTRKLITSVINY